MAKDRKLALVEIHRMNQAKLFPVNTCPASRHVAGIAENLAKDGKDYLLDSEPRHCAVSLAAVVHGLWAARTKLAALGYTWTVDSSGKIIWRSADETVRGEE